MGKGEVRRRRREEEGEVRRRGVGREVGRGGWEEIERRRGGKEEKD